MIKRLGFGGQGELPPMQELWNTVVRLPSEDPLVSCKIGAYPVRGWRRAAASSAV